MAYKPQILTGNAGGTGINNGTSTFTIGGNTSFVGAFTFAGTVTGNTAVTFPTSGTLSTTSQIPSLPLSLANGGTNANLTASNGGIFYSTASAGAILSGTSTANQVLLSGSSTTPAWSTATYPATTTAFQLIVSTAANTIGEITAGTTGTVLTGVTGAVPAFSATPTVTSITFGSGTALSTYQEGTFTPSLTFGGSGTGITYASQSGTYVKIGKIVHCTVQMDLSSKGAQTGTAVLSGLPFAAVNLTQQVIIQMANVTLGASNTWCGLSITPTGTTATFFQDGSGQALSVLTNTNFGNSTATDATFTYIAAS